METGGSRCSVAEPPEATWDGKPIHREKPYGASIVVFRASSNGIEFLMLHRAHLGLDFEGAWAWTPPSGARQRNESIDSCAQRELMEESGLTLAIQLTRLGTEDWSIYIAEAPANSAIKLDSEHDRFEWLTADRAISRCQPEVPNRLLCAATEYVLGLSKE